MPFAIEEDMIDLHLVVGSLEALRAIWYFLRFPRILTSMSRCSWIHEGCGRTLDHSNSPAQLYSYVYLILSMPGAMIWRM